MLTGMNEQTNGTPFERVCRAFGSYAAVGSIFTPTVSPQGVSKWAEAGVPGERVLPICRHIEYEVTPHELRPDLYPHPEDGLPSERRRRRPAQGRAAA